MLRRVMLQENPPLPLPGGDKNRYPFLGRDEGRHPLPGWMNAGIPSREG